MSRSKSNSMSIDEFTLSICYNHQGSDGTLSCINRVKPTTKVAKLIRTWLKSDDAHKKAFEELQRDQQEHLADQFQIHTCRCKQGLTGNSPPLDPKQSVQAENLDNGDAVFITRKQGTNSSSKPRASQSSSSSLPSFTKRPSTSNPPTSSTPPIKKPRTDPQSHPQSHAPTQSQSKSKITTPWRDSPQSYTRDSTASSNQKVRGDPSNEEDDDDDDEILFEQERAKYKDILERWEVAVDRIADEKDFGPRKVKELKEAFDALNNFVKNVRRDGGYELEV